MKPEQVAEEADNRTTSETPRGLIKRPDETSAPQARKVVINSTTIIDSSDLLAAIGDASAASTPAEASVAATGQNQTDTVQQVASVMDQDEFDIPLALELTPSSYMVLIEQPETQSATRDLVTQLRDAGVNDFLVFENGANKGHISLGVFSTRANATNRQQMLGQLGFTSFTTERYQ